MPSRHVNNTVGLLRLEEGDDKIGTNGLHYVYKDSLGYWTVDPGILLDGTKGGGLYDEEVDFIVKNRATKAENYLLSHFDWYHELDEVRKAVVISMVYQLGSLRGWPKFCNAMSLHDYNLAAMEALDSVVARTETPERFKQHAQMLISGQWP